MLPLRWLSPVLLMVTSCRLLSPTIACILLVSLAPLRRKVLPVPSTQLRRSSLALRRYGEMGSMTIPPRRRFDPRRRFPLSAPITASSSSSWTSTSPRRRDVRIAVVGEEESLPSCRRPLLSGETVGTTPMLCIRITLPLLKSFVLSTAPLPSHRRPIYEELLAALSAPVDGGSIIRLDSSRSLGISGEIVGIIRRQYM